MEKAISCTSVRISSHFGDHVWYQYDSGDAMGPFAVATKKNKSKRKVYVPWWNRNDLMTFDADGDISVTGWDELELGWEESDTEEVIEFKPERTAEVIDIKKTRKNKFHAEVIEGGKKDEN